MSSNDMGLCSRCISEWMFSGEGEWNLLGPAEKRLYFLGVERILIGILLLIAMFFLLVFGWLAFLILIPCLWLFTSGSFLCFKLGDRTSILDISKLKAWALKNKAIQQRVEKIALASEEIPREDGSASCPSCMSFKDLDAGFCGKCGRKL